MNTAIPNNLAAMLKNFSERNPARKMPKRVPYPNLQQSGTLTQYERWVSILWSIDSAQANGKHALRGLAIALSQVIRAQAIETMVMDARERHKPAWDADDLLWDDSLPLNTAGDTRASLLKKVSRTLSVDLNDAVVFPSPWER